MAPNATLVNRNDNQVVKDDVTPPDVTPYKRQLVWRNILLFVLLHGAAFGGLILVFTSAKLMTTAFAYLLYIVSGLGITAGAHRLWTHRSYKAKWPLRLLLVTFNTIAFQNDILNWVRDHRVHHKYSETDADPHNATRGFFFAHMGWLLVRKHPRVKEKGRVIDLSDVEADRFVAFQKKYYVPLVILQCFVFPTIIPMLLWEETFANSFYVPCLLRYCILLHCTWLVNSAAHIWGNKPYDRFINPVENKSVVLGALGEGWHNFHHTFPWDYRTGEVGGGAWNVTALFINAMAALGLAYDLKMAEPSVVKQRVARTGDGSHPISKQTARSDINSDISDPNNQHSTLYQ